MKGAYYNEIDPYAAQWLRNLAADGLIPQGDVDERSIVDVQPDDLRGYVQCHFFAGLGGWPYALRIAGWPDDRPIWTGSCPCQPFSAAGKRAGTDDPRHLWPDFFRLIRAGRPPQVLGEQVAGKAGYGWFDGVAADLGGEGYASRAVDFPAAAVDAPHIRNRLYWIATDEALGQSNGDGRQSGLVTPEIMGHGRASVPGGRLGRAARLADAAGGQLPEPFRRPQGRDGAGPACAANALADADEPRACEAREQRGRQLMRSGGDPRDRTLVMVDSGPSGLPLPERGAVPGPGRREEGGATPEPSRAQLRRNGTFWSDSEWLIGADGKARRIGVGVRRVDHGLPAGLDSLRASEAGSAALPLPLLTKGEPARVGKLRGLGNAIVPQAAVEVIAAFMECAP